MHTPVLLSTGAIIAIAVGAAAAALVIFLILHFAVFGRGRTKRAVKELLDRYDTTHSILFSTDAQYIKRLEAIASMNLTYIADFEAWNRRYIHARDVSDAEASSKVSHLHELLEEGRYKEVKEMIPEVRKEIENFERDVSSLDSGLINKFKDEEDCRNLVLSLRDRSRALKAGFAARSGDLLLVQASFEKVYEKVESRMKEAISLIDDAKYAEARTILEGQVDKVLSALEKALPELPGICISVERLLPDKINDLQARYLDLRRQGYPLSHLLSEEDPDRMRQKTAELASLASSFRIDGIREEAERLLDRIEAIEVSFQTEVEARHSFESTVSHGYQGNESVSTGYVDLCQALPRIREIYVISDEAETNFQKLDALVNESAATKRLLDTYVHSSAKQPYTVLLEKTKSLEEQGKAAQDALDSFRDYLASLKNGAETCSKALRTYYERLKSAENFLKKFRSPVLEEKFAPRFEECYQNIDLLYRILSLRPIDVEKALACLSVLQEKGDGVIGEIEALEGARENAEKAIVRSNRERLNSSEADSLLRQAETFYFSGEYQLALKAAEDARKAAIVK